jgi:hypothetical protein
VLLVACCSVHAGEPFAVYDGCRWSFPKLCQEWRQRQCWCHDDYDRKSLPCVPPNETGCVDDYCGKPLPCVPPNQKGCVDDYCPRKCPLFLGPLCEPWYQCGPPPGSGCGPCSPKR